MNLVCILNYLNFPLCPLPILWHLKRLPKKWCLRRLKFFALCLPKSCLYLIDLNFPPLPAQILFVFKWHEFSPFACPNLVWIFNDLNFALACANLIAFEKVAKKSCAYNDLNFTLCVPKSCLYFEWSKFSPLACANLIAGKWCLQWLKFSPFVCPNLVCILNNLNFPPRPAQILVVF